jgi:rhodanese-related sulfurtransferase
MTNVISIKPEQAWQLLQDDSRAVLIDVRSSMEFLFVGHPKGAINIPWIDEPDWDINPNFVNQIQATLKKTDASNISSRPVLLICRSGIRSLEAGETLFQAGFTLVYNIIDGFEGPRDAENHRSTLGGWRYQGLPWEQC